MCNVITIPAKTVAYTKDRCSVTLLFDVEDKSWQYILTVPQDPIILRGTAHSQAAARNKADELIAQLTANQQSRSTA